MRQVGPVLLTLVAGWSALAVLAALVWLLPRLPEPFWPIPLILAAAPLAWHLVEWRLTKRRALLGNLTRRESRLRAWLWPGTLLRLGAALAAVAVVTILTVSAGLLAWQHWAVLAAYVLVLALAAGPLRAALGSEVDAAHLGTILRHGPLYWAGALILGAAFLALGFVLDQPDLRGEAFAALLESAYREGGGRAEAASLQPLLGAANAVRMGFWYWAQIVGTQLDSTAAWGFWLVVLLAAGGFASLVNAYVLACVGLAERIGADSATGTAGFRLGFVATLAAIGALSVAASWTAPRLPLDPPKLPERMVSFLDPCGTSRAAAVEALAAATGDLAAAARQERQRSEAEIEAAVSRAFADLEPAVDAYLDWYFSLPGEYARIWHHFFGDGAAYLAGRFEEAVLADLRPQLAEALGTVESRSAGRLQAMAARHSAALRAALEPSNCLAPPPPEAPTSIAAAGPRHVYGAVSGATAGVAAGLAVGARPLASRIVGRTALSRGISAGGGAAAGAAICGASGPGAILCGVAAGIGAWIAVDVLVLWGDEYLSRDGMRAEIVAALDETRRELAGALAAANEARIATAIEAIRAAEARLFAPIHEGVGRPRQS